MTIAPLPRRFGGLLWVTINCGQVAVMSSASVAYWGRNSSYPHSDIKGAFGRSVAFESLMLAHTWAPNER